MTLGRQEIIEYLSEDDPARLDELYARARDLRGEHFGDKIFLYGFVYFSTYCRNNCAFCYFRRSNDIERYRKDPDEILLHARSLADSGVVLIDLTMGEDSSYKNEGYQTLIDISQKIKSETGLPVMISPGVIDKKYVDLMSEAGIDWYALYQETHNRELFSRLRLEQDYDERMRLKKYAGEVGMLIEEGIMTGIGESAADIADSLLAMGETGATQMRAMTFVPQEGTPMENMVASDKTLEIRIIALMRIMYPRVLIPATLDVEGIAGLKARINAGANVVTSIIPPRSGLKGVAQSEMDVDEGGRTSFEVANILNGMSLRPASPEEYSEYLASVR